LVAIKTRQIGKRQHAATHGILRTRRTDEVGITCRIQQFERSNACLTAGTPRSAGANDDMFNFSPRAVLAGEVPPSARWFSDIGAKHLAAAHLVRLVLSNKIAGADAVAGMKNMTQRRP